MVLSGQDGLMGHGNETRENRIKENRVSQASPQSPSPLWPASQQPGLMAHTQFLPTLQGTASIPHPPALGNGTLQFLPQRLTMQIRISRTLRNPVTESQNFLNILDYRNI